MLTPEEKKIIDIAIYVLQRPKDEVVITPANVDKLFDRFPVHVTEKSPEEIETPKKKISGREFVANKNKQRMRAVVTCGICGGKGHNKSTCQKSNDDEEEKEYQKRMKSKEPYDASLHEPISIEQFFDVHESVKHKMTSKDIAENMDVHIAEINMAIASRSYESYLKLREE